MHGPPLSLAVCDDTGVETKRGDGGVVMGTGVEVNDCVGVGVEVGIAPHSAAHSLW